MKINVYIDGFNLYYGSLKGTGYKWLNPMTMCQLLFANDTINRIKYFTARVSARPTDPDQPIRQNTYFRALRTVPQIEIIEGAFVTKEVTMPLANSNPQQYARVIKRPKRKGGVSPLRQILSRFPPFLHRGHKITKNQKSLILI